MWSNSTRNISSAKKSEKSKKKSAIFSRKQRIFWSCWADLNRRPHPYQISKACCRLSLSIFSYRLLSLIFQGFAAFFTARCRCLLFPVTNGFLMMVSVLCRFLKRSSTVDLIPFCGAICPMQSGHRSPHSAFSSIPIYCVM